MLLKAFCKVPCCGFIEVYNPFFNFVVDCLLLDNLSFLLDNMLATKFNL